MATENPNNKIFNLSRIKYDELWADAIEWIKATYNTAKEKFTVASPFAQLLSVILHLGRMIFYYIEDSITGLNIKTAYRPDQIKGLAMLTGHDAGRAIAARGAVKLAYYSTNGNDDYIGQVCYIPNKISLLNTINGLNYVLLFSADSAKITMKTGNYVTANIVQGTLKYQQATSNGLALQSFNFTERNHADIDQYYANVYVNGELWLAASSLLDLGYEQKGCVIRTGISDGIDIFFGNDDYGAIPDEGSTILFEYIVTEGGYSNMPKDYVNSDIYWQFKDVGYLSDGSEVNLNENFKITCETDIIFGTEAEDTALTQKIAPYSSRSMVLANEINYRYFLAKMNMFSIIEIFKGFKSLTNSSAQAAYDTAYLEYTNANADYIEKVGLYGEKSQQTQEAYSLVLEKMEALNNAQSFIDDSEINDNTIYMLLIPDIKKRISSSVNYFTCDEDLFFLSEEEKENILNLIDLSGQKVLTIENRIIDPKIIRFAINADIKIFEGYDEETIYSDAIDAISNYLLNIQNKNIIPTSDIIALLEKINGINSVKVTFAADVENQYIYGKSNYYGIDSFGDIILTREVTNNLGETIQIKDMFPLFRGGFTDINNINYNKTQSFTELSGFNLNISEINENTTINISNLNSVNS